MALDVRHPPKNAKEAVDFLSFLIQRIDMRVASDPELGNNPHGYYCNAAGNEGVTASGILETSHTVIHAWDNDFPAKFQFDLYSCKDFDVPYVINLCNAFGILGGTYLLIDRNDTLDVIETGKIGDNGVILHD